MTKNLLAAGGALAAVGIVLTVNLVGGHEKAEEWRVANVRLEEKLERALNPPTFSYRAPGLSWGDNDPESWTLEEVMSGAPFSTDGLWGEPHYSDEEYAALGIAGPAPDVPAKYQDDFRTTDDDALWDIYRVTDTGPMKARLATVKEGERRWVK